MRSKRRVWWRVCLVGALVVALGLAGVFVVRTRDRVEPAVAAQYVIGTMTVRFDALMPIYQALATVEVFHVERIIATPGATTIEEYARHSSDRTSYRVQGPQRRLQAELGVAQTVFKPGATSEGFVPRWLSVQPASAVANGAVASSMAEELERYLPQDLVQRMEPIARGYRLVGASGTVSADLVFDGGVLQELFVVGVDATSHAWPGEAEFGAVDGPILAVEPQVAHTVITRGVWDGSVVAGWAMPGRRRLVSELDAGLTVLAAQLEANGTRREILSSLEAQFGDAYTLHDDGISGGPAEVGFQWVLGQWGALAVRGGDGRCYVGVVRWPEATRGYAAGGDVDCVARLVDGPLSAWANLLKDAA